MAETIPVRPRRESTPARNVAIVPKAPKHLSRESKALFNDIIEKWILGPDGLAILCNALESRDAYELCRKEVLKNGPTFTTPTGQTRANPAAKLSIDYLSSFRQAMRQLGLDPEK